MHDLSTIDIFFYLFATLATFFSLFVVLGKNPISNAFSLVAVFFCVSAIYALMQAHFLAAIQILVYAGAIMVLFVFVIMLLNADNKNLDLTKHKGFQLGAGALCLMLLAIFGYAIHAGGISQQRGIFSSEKIDALGGNVQVLSQLMFSDFLLPFELTSVLLLVAIVGSVALAKRRGKTNQLQKGIES